MKIAVAGGGVAALTASRKAPGARQSPAAYAETDNNAQPVAWFTRMQSPPLKPERWTLSAGDGTTATLHIPPDAARVRRFEIACAITVAVPASSAAAAQPWHQMTVQANGVQQWRRRLPSQNAGEWDGLDYRFSRTVDVGEALRVTVAVSCGAGARRRTLQIEADELS